MECDATSWVTSPRCYGQRWLQMPAAGSEYFGVLLRSLATDCLHTSSVCSGHLPDTAALIAGASPLVGSPARPRDRREARYSVVGSTHAWRDRTRSQCVAPEYQEPVHDLDRCRDRRSRGCIAIYDLTQRQHAILRTFPIIGHVRYWLEAIGPSSVNTSSPTTTRSARSAATSGDGSTRRPNAKTTTSGLAPTTRWSCNHTI